MGRILTGDRMRVAARAIGIGDPLGGGGVSISSLLGANGVYFDFTRGALIENNTQPVLVNGGFESGVTGWSWTGLATFDTVAGGRPGGTGASIARLVSTGVVENHWVLQSAVTISGNHYTLSGWLSHDDAVNLRTGDGSIILAPPPGGWQYVSGSGTTGATAVLIRLLAESKSAYADDITLANNSVKACTPVVARGALAGVTGSQTTAANMPYEASGGLTGDGGDYLPAGSAANWAFLHSGVGASVFAVVNRGTSTDRYVLGTRDSTARNAFALYINAGGNLQFVVDNASGTIVNDTHASVIPASQLAIVEGHFVSGTWVHAVNAVEETGSPTGSPSSADPAIPLWILGAYSAGSSLIGSMAGLVVSGYMGPDTRAAMRGLLASKYGVSL